jgi:hypothetical protein
MISSDTTAVMAVIRDPIRPQIQNGPTGCTTIRRFVAHDKVAAIKVAHDQKCQAARLKFQDGTEHALYPDGHQTRIVQKVRGKAARKALKRERRDARLQMTVTAAQMAGA